MLDDREPGDRPLRGGDAEPDTGAAVRADAERGVERARDVSFRRRVDSLDRRQQGSGRVSVPDVADGKHRAGAVCRGVCVSVLLQLVVGCGVSSYRARIHTVRAAVFPEDETADSADTRDREPASGEDAGEFAASDPAIDVQLHTAHDGWDRGVATEPLRRDREAVEADGDVAHWGDSGFSDGVLGGVSVGNSGAEEREHHLRDDDGLLAACWADTATVGGACTADARADTIAHRVYATCRDRGASDRGDHGGESDAGDNLSRRELCVSAAGAESARPFQPHVCGGEPDGDRRGDGGREEHSATADTRTASAPGGGDRGAGEAGDRVCAAREQFAERDHQAQLADRKGRRDRGRDARGATCGGGRLRI